MPSIEEILKAQAKPKEKEQALVSHLRAQPAALEQLLDYYPRATKSEKGTCMAALAAISADDPTVVVSHLDFVIGQISADAPRVKWESSEIIARIAAEYPEGAASAIPALIENTSHEGTVVRWSAAYALTEIARSNPASREKLIPLFREMAVGETQNGVRKLYEKALKALES